MDPITNPTQSNTNDASQVVGAPQLDPSLVIPTAPVEPSEMSQTMGIPTAPVNPSEPLTPVMPVANEPTVSVEPQPMAANTTVPVMGEAPMGDGLMGGAVNPATMVTPGYMGGIGAMDPITMPTPPKAPDPVEEELKAPFKAAEPVPGSIGSAISMPAQGAALNQSVDTSMFQKPNTTNVALGGKTVGQATAAQAPMQAGGKSAKKKTSKATYILLGVVGVMVVIALVAVLITQLTS